jgi:bifunctional non-homologous end joining protein LigD
VALGFPVAPMKATMGSTGAVPDGDDWAFEVKWDGYRTIVHLADGAVRLQSTAGHDVTGRWPEFAGLAGAVNATSAILDGELIVFDDHGRPSFELVQRSGVGSERQAVIQLFDVLAVEGTDTIDLSYLDRRRLLEQLVEPGDNWTVPAFGIGNGPALVAATAEQGLEGVIAKRIDSRYRPGTRSKDWRKIKNRTTVELVIGGFTAGTGKRSSTFGALLVGRHTVDGLRFAGGVGTGFDERTLATLTGRLRSLVRDACPFDPPPPTAVARTATWVEPSLHAVVEIAEFTNEGHVRHGSFIRLAT